MKITHASITLMPRPMPKGMFYPRPEVVTHFENGCIKNLFTFQPEKVSFKPPEFIRLTE